MLKHTVFFAAVAAFWFALPALLAQNTVQTFAGGGPNKLPALKASLGFPASVSMDAAGNLYLFDEDSERVLKMDTHGSVTVAAGSGLYESSPAFADQVYGYSPDGTPPLNAMFNATAAYVDAAGNIYIADTYNCMIRKVDTTGALSTIAGQPPAGSPPAPTCGYTGDTGPATSAQLDFPAGVFVDSSGNVFIADSGNDVIRVVAAADGNIYTVAGNQALGAGYFGDGGPATSAQLDFPTGVFVDSSGNIFVADTSNSVIREVNATARYITTVAGNQANPCSSAASGDGGPATAASLCYPSSISVDSSGNLFIADQDDNAIRKVTAINGTLTNSNINTVAGTYQVWGYSGDGGLATAGLLSYPSGVFLDRSGNLLIADTDNSVIRAVNSSANISTLAGVSVPDPSGNGQMDGLAEYSGDGYAAVNAELGYPMAASMAADSSGNIFIADTDNNAIREVSAATHTISTVAGTGLPGYFGDGGPATQAMLSNPTAVALDASGNIFIADWGNCVVRKITLSTGNISTVAGTPGTCGYFGDGGPATSAQLYSAIAVFVDASGNIFIADTGNPVTDPGNQVIREVTAADGNINTVAGTPGVSGNSGDTGSALAATLNYPSGVLVDSSGDIFISDTGNCAVREVTVVDENINTVAGTNGTCGYSGDGNPAASAQISNPFGLFLDYAGNLFIPDSGNSVVREVVPTPGVSPLAGTISTVAGSGAFGFSGDGGAALSAAFAFPSAAAADQSGNLLVLDAFRVRAVSHLAQTAPEAIASPNPLPFATAPLGTASAAQQVTLTNPGTASVTVSTVSISGANAADFSETDDCAGQILQGEKNSCTVNVIFTPSVAGNEAAQLVIADTAGTPPVGLSGAGIDFSVAAAPTGSLSATVTQGGTANYSLQVTATGGASSSDQVSVTVTCAGAPSEAACSATPKPVVATVAAHGALTVTVTTTAPTKALLPPLSGPGTRLPRGLLPFGVTLLFALWLFTRMRSMAIPSRGRLAWLALTAPILLALILGGCGSSTSNTPPPPPPSGGTPAGTYTLTLTATAGSDVHTAKLTLTVTAAQ